MTPKYYELKEKVTNVELFQMLKEAARHKWNYSIKTDLDRINFRDADYDDIDMRDKWGEIQCSNDVYKIVGFIVIECIAIESVEIFNSKNTITLFENIVHFTGSADELREMIAQLSLSPEFWIDFDKEPET